MQISNRHGNYKLALGATTPYIILALRVDAVSDTAGHRVIWAL